MRRILTLSVLVVLGLAYVRGWLQISRNGLQFDGARFSADTGIPLEGSDAEKSDQFFERFRAVESPPGGTR